MQLESGTRLGEYEIVAPVGAGGMGEVYRARDHRLGRDVAVKILPAGLLDNQDRLQRFQREAQSAGGLNHPNLLTIHELGVDKGRPFIVSELLDGSTLRERMAAGPMAPKRAIEYASQIAEGLAAAHERGIVHRDLKPENIFVTRDGRVKILDFGLAKSVGPVTAGGGSETVEKSLTDPGAVVGTVGYMSPEQVRGDSVDARSDIFTLGAILYEMLSGRRAFHGTSSVDTLHAILHEDPPELSQTNAQIPPALARIVGHCLEKDPERRFQSARDLAFALSSMSGVSTDAVLPKQRAKMRVAPLWIVVAIVAAAAVSWFASRATLHRPEPRFQRLTFRSFGSPTAAFTADEQSIVYSAPTLAGADVSVSAIGSGEMRPLGIKGDVLSVSKNGELAVLLNSRFTGGFISTGTLARVPLAGGAPREILEDVQWADWSPSGDELAILRTVGGSSRIEMPPGTVRYQTGGWITTPRVSPDGKTIAFLEHPVASDDAGFVAVVDMSGHKRVLTGHYASAQGLAWTPDGGEIWFTAAKEGNMRALHGVTLSGKERLIVSAPGILFLHAIARDGRALVSLNNVRQRLFVRGPNDQSDRELSWLDWSLLRDLSRDGRRVLFDETGEGAGPKYGVYVRDADGSPAVRLGDGVTTEFSPDGRFVLAFSQVSKWAQIFVYPTGAGEPRQLTNDPMNHTGAGWTPDGRSIVFRATDATHPAHLYVRDLGGGTPRLVTPDPVASLPPLCSPDGNWVAARNGGGSITLYPLHGGSPITLPELTREDVPFGWTEDGKELRYFRRSENPVHVRSIDPLTHRSRAVRDVPLPDALFGAANIRMTPDGRTYAYTIVNSTADLYLLDGVRAR